MFDQFMSFIFPPAQASTLDTPNVEQPTPRPAPSVEQPTSRPEGLMQ
jgi:hypothetical protein